MKKFFLVVILLVTITMQSQGQHEAKFDVFDLIVFKALDITYQYNLNEEASIGLSFYNNLSDKKNIFGRDERFTITPYYRQYFPIAGAENVFVEGFFAINTGSDFEDVENMVDGVGTGEFHEEELKYTDGAFGFAVGKSFISPRGFVLDLYAGIGRNLFDSPGAPKIVPRIGINTGFRF